MRFILVAAIILGSLSINAQDNERKNLIANPSFEQNNGKIKKLGEASKALEEWTTATKTKADVFSPTALLPIAGIPNNGMGKANAKDGDNYVGLKIYDFNSKGGRAYLTSALNDHLEKGKRYCLSYNISLADVSKYATNNFGVHLSKKEIYEELDALIKDDVILPMNNLVQDNMKTWTNICVPFTAKGFEKYITIGNFHASNKTATKTVRKPKSISQPQLPIGYYYVDNFSILQIDNDSECTCKEDKLVEGPKIIYSKQEELQKGSSYVKKIGAAAVYFYSLKSDLVSASNRELDKLAEVLIAKPSVKVVIHGHTDNTEEIRLKQEDDYENISEQRAESVKTYLLGKGVDEGQLSTIGHKATKPTSKMKTPISLAKNRRVLFTIKE
ncbi:MAG: OOP family OmpA-OmpF porin [Patiriisocius sp.]|jgi:OOP family OmpA-OmpF porin